MRNRDRQERSDEAIQESLGALRSPGLLRHSPSGRTGVFRRPIARNDDVVYSQALVIWRKDGAGEGNRTLV
jgi:hypothetical protein